MVNGLIHIKTLKERLWSNHKTLTHTMNTVFVISVFAFARLFMSRFPVHYYSSGFSFYVCRFLFLFMPVNSITVSPLPPLNKPQILETCELIMLTHYQEWIQCLSSLLFLSLHDYFCRCSHYYSGKNNVLP